MNVLGEEGKVWSLEWIYWEWGFNWEDGGKKGVGRGEEVGGGLEGGVEDMEKKGGVGDVVSFGGKGEGSGDAHFGEMIEERVGLGEK